MIGRAFASLAFSLLVAFVATGCGASTEKKDDPYPKPDEVITRPAEDPPSTDTKSPPMGKPRAKVAPSSETHSRDLRATDSFYRDETPH